MAAKRHCLQLDIFIMFLLFCQGINSAATMFADTTIPDTSIRTNSETTAFPHTTIPDTELPTTTDVLPTTEEATTRPQMTHPRITVEPSDLVVQEGQSAVLNCSAEGRPTPTIQWYHDNSLVHDTLNRLMLRSGSLLLLHVLRSGSERNTGTYWCTATNTVGTARSRSASIEATAAPTPPPTQPPRTECSNPRSVPSLKWYLYQDHCYSASIGSLSYEQGKEFCRRNGGSLASVHSSSEMNFILSLLLRYSGGYWIGLRKDFPNDYRWEDGTSVDYTIWSSGYEDDDDYYILDSFSDRYDDSATHASQDVCTAFTPPQASWYKPPCSNKLNAICKSGKDFDATASTTASLIGSCPEGWYTFGDNCYNVLGRSRYQQKGWNDAAYECAKISSNLVSVHSSEEQGFLNGLQLEVNSRIWIGLSRPTASGSFSWKDNSPVDYTNWDAGEPNDHLSAGENCVQLLRTNSVLGKWNDAPCNLKFPYICQKTKDLTNSKPALDPSLCVEPAGWLNITNSCYKVFQGNENSVPWLKAQDLCTNLSSNLASLKNLVVTAELRPHMKDLDGYFWIGVSSLLNHRYTWIEGGPLIYSNWQSGQPHDVSDTENCVAMNPEGEWMVRSCSENLPYICETNQEFEEPPMLLPHSENMTCPDVSQNWHDFGGDYCYIIEVQKKLTWYMASCRCTREGGFLVSFHSTDEVNVLTRHLKDISVHLHIGLERDYNDRFIWTDKSAVDFDNWNSGEPGSSAKQCGALWTETGKWDSIQCFATHGYICSALKVPVVEEPEPKAVARASESELAASMISMIAICILSVLAIVAVSLHYYYTSVKVKTNADEMTHFTKMEF